ncbi:MAG: ATPase [Sphingomonas sp.]|nr:ATPase [Sphingomonas sp.]
MPQIEQLPQIFFSQLFWLLLVFGIIYFAIGRGMVPKIQSVVDSRDRKIAEDLAAAQRAREEAEGAEAAWRERIDASRSEAMKLAQEAKQQGGRDAEQRLKAIDGEIGARIAEAQARIRDAAEQARRELEPVAAQAASELVAKLTGRRIAPAEAEPMVKAALHG